MGNSQKKPKELKLEHAAKTGALNVADMNLKPTSSLWQRLVIDGLATKLKSLDISGNSLKALPVEIYDIANLKYLIAARCNLQKSSNMASLAKLVNIDFSNNDFEGDALKPLPTNLQRLNLSNNHFQSFPLVLTSLVLLAELNLSGNRLESMTGVGSLVSLSILILDDNLLTEVSEDAAQLVSLIHISLRNNRITRTSPTTGRQSIPAAFFVQTRVERIELSGNSDLRISEVVAFDGVSNFLERRKRSKEKSFQGGAMTDMALFGLT